MDELRRRLRILCINDFDAGPALSTLANGTNASASGIEKQRYSIDTLTPCVGFSRLQLSSTARLRRVTGPGDAGSHS